MFHRSNPIKHPALYQYNPLKYALLIYRVCWKIEQKKIYSLITKCQIVNHYIWSCLFKYLERQENIFYLHKFMLEPLIGLEEDQNILDILLQMNMEDTLNHPVVVEVLNLVQEG